MDAWADRIIGIWDMVSDFSGFLAKAKVKLGFVFVIVDEKPMILANPQLTLPGIEGILSILGKNKKLYAKRAYEIAQSAPTYSAVRRLEKMLFGKEGA